MASKRPPVVTVPGASPTPDPVTARPVTVPNGKKKTTKKTTKTKIAMILDRSGSMNSRKEDVIGGYNTYLNDQKKAPGSEDTTLTLVLFDDVITTVHNDVPIATVPELNGTTYRIGNTTALLDAVGKTIVGLDNQVDEETRVLVVIMTDGLENASKEFTRTGIKQMITDREAKGNWTFSFMGADQDAFAEAGKIGIQIGNTVAHSGKEYVESMNRLSNVTSTYRASTDRQTKTLFRPDADPDLLKR